MDINRANARALPQSRRGDWAIKPRRLVSASATNLNKLILIILILKDISYYLFLHFKTHTNFFFFKFKIFKLKSNLEIRNLILVYIFRNKFSKHEPNETLTSGGKFKLALTPNFIHLLLKSMESFIYTHKFRYERWSNTFYPLS